MTYKLLGLFFLICYTHATWVQWDGTPIDQLLADKTSKGQQLKIRVEIINNYIQSFKALSPAQYFYPSNSWYYWQPWILAGTTNGDDPSTVWTVLSASTYQHWDTPAKPYVEYQYTGWTVTLKNDVKGVLYAWQGQYAMDPANPNVTPATIVISDQTYNSEVKLNAPFVWFIKPNQYYPNAFEAGGSTCLISADKPIGHWSWITDSGAGYLNKELCKMRLWIESGVVETKIWSCDGTSSKYHFDPAAIRYLAQSADSIIIRSNNNANEYIKTTPNSYALDSLRVGRALSFTPQNGNAITADWTGPMINSMWNNGLPSASLSFFTVPYWACDNQAGLHLGNTDNWCKWVWNQPGTPGGISIYITRNLDANIPIWRCDTTTQTPLLSSKAAYSAIGYNTKAITIYSTKNRADYVTTTSPNAYAINSLKAGQSIAFQTNGGYAVASDWSGSKQANMWNSCGWPGSFYDDPYWACNNGGGLHLRKGICNWISDAATTPAGGISIEIQPLVKPPARFIRIWSCTVSGQYALDFPLSQIQTLAGQANAVTIMSRNNIDEYVTSTSSSFALESLRAGKSLSHSLSNGYTASSHWVGTKVDQVWNSCGSSQPFDVVAYWACNNGNGLHLSTSICGWNSGGNAPNGGIGIYLHMPNY